MNTRLKSPKITKYLNHSYNHPHEAQMASSTSNGFTSAPPEAIYTDIPTLVAAIQAHASSNGYAFCTRSTQPHRILYTCDREGQYNPKGKTPSVHPTKRRKNTGSKKCGCMMRAVAKRTADGMAWELKIMEATHNHRPSGAPSAHPAHRIGSLDPQVRAAIVNF